MFLFLLLIAIVISQAFKRGNIHSYAIFLRLLIHFKTIL